MILYSPSSAAHVNSSPNHGNFPTDGDGLWTSVPWKHAEGVSALSKRLGVLFVNSAIAYYLVLNYRFRRQALQSKCLNKRF